MGKKLFVGNLSWDTTDKTLKEFFEQIGEVVEANVVLDRLNHRSRGFGFVTMSSEEDAKKAMEELDGQSLDGREIRVDEAKPKND
jgi:RNA recognition motif-containing protein